ncbi:hypothetical protein BDZ45DRAFT_706740 [Acephala macrosclerotiorum]|nr:hypothetical protein BDZ45DRAFT_706740 [Acephala macrosclerotiorum]
MDRHQNHKRILLYCTATFGAGMCFGYDTIANGATISMPGFDLSFGAVTADAMGRFLIAFVSDRVGRMRPCVGACLLSIAGVEIQFGATSRAMLLRGKMASEISPMRPRGPIQGAIILFMFSIQAIRLVVVRMFVPDLTTHSFQVVFAAQWAWPVATGLLFNEIEARLAHMALGSYADLLKGSNLKRTLAVVWMFVGFGFAGACLLTQAIYFPIIAGLEAIHSYNVAIGKFGIAIFGIVASWFLTKKTGKRAIFLVGAAVNCVVMFVVGGLYYSYSKGALWGVAIITYTAWAITSEISSYRLRVKTQGVAVISNTFSSWLFTFTVARIYNVDAGDLGIRASFVYGGGSLLFLIFSFFLVPDLRGFSTEEVDWSYENKVPVWKIQENAAKAKEGVQAMEANMQHEKVVV